ncbi:MAG: competence protein CoiA [Bacillaceae bacterium]
MLVAINQQGEKVMLTPHLNKSTLLKWKKEISFYCPICQSKLHLKVGTKKIPHFAHEKASLCSGSEGESSLHLEGKLKLFEWMKKQNKKVELEKYFHAIGQRADIYFQMDGNKVALELQCSTIPASLFVERTAGYHQQHIHVLWIFGSNQWKRLGTVSAKITSFLSLGSIYTPQGYMLLFYSNEQDSFIQLSPLFAFSPQLVYGHIHLFPRKSTRFYELVTCKKSNLSFLLVNWNRKKKKYRLFAHEYFYPHFLSFIMFLHSFGLPPGCFPSEAAIPLINGYFIETPIIIWQTYLVMDCLHPIGMENSFHLFDVKSYIENKAKRGEIKFRTLPLVKEKDLVDKLLREYLFFLCEGGILKKIGDDTYQKIGSSVFPTRIEEAIRRDEEYCKIIEKVLKEGIQ